MHLSEDLIVTPDAETRDAKKSIINTTTHVRRHKHFCLQLDFVAGPALVSATEPDPPEGYKVEKQVWTKPVLSETVSQNRF